MGKPTHVVCNASLAAGFTLGRVYQTHGQSCTGGVLARTNDGRPFYLYGHRPATPEEVALGHCSHVVALVSMAPFVRVGIAYPLGGLHPCGDAAIRLPDSDSVPNFTLLAGEWRPATLEEITREPTR